MKTDVLIVGAGLAGLTAGWQTASQGRSTRVVAKGWGATHWGSGCVGVLGYLPSDPETAVQSPEAAVRRLIESNRRHPYALAGLDTLAEALEAFQQLCAAAGYPLHGSLEHNWLLPSAVGTARPTCLAPETMIEGDMQRHDPMLIVGFDACLEFCPSLVADNLDAQGIPARDVTLDLPRLRQRRVMNTTILARLFDDPDFREEVADQLAPKLGQAARIGFPAVLGMDDALLVVHDLEERLGCPVFEIPILPPSIPGMRWHRILVAAIERAKGQVFTGMEAVAANAEEQRMTRLWTEAAARRKSHQAKRFVLATGGILGGGIVADSEGQIREVVCDLPVWAPAERSRWFRRDFLDASGHPIYRAGVEVNGAYQPLDSEGQVVYENLMVIGTGLAHCDALRERAFEGVALVTGYQAGKLIGQESNPAAPE